MMKIKIILTGIGHLVIGHWAFSRSEMRLPTKMTLTPSTGPRAEFTDFPQAEVDPYDT